MSFDPKTTERISPDAWLNSPLSLARFSGGISINGRDYFVDPRTNELVRDDIFRKEAKQRAADRKTKRRPNSSPTLPLN